MKIENQSLVDKIEERLAQGIIAGEFDPGEKLSEKSLAEALGVSRGPLREAISRLEGRKLVQRSPNRGVRIASLSKSDLVEILVIREALEGMACRLAAKKMTGEELDALDDLLSKHRNQSDVMMGLAYAQSPSDYDFHFRIAEGSRNERLVSMICGDLYDLVRVYRFKASTTKGRTADALAEHEAIVEALKSRDPDAAEAAMRKHVRNSREKLVRLFDEDAE